LFGNGVTRLGILGTVIPSRRPDSGRFRGEKTDYVFYGESLETGQVVNGTGVFNVRPNPVGYLRISNRPGQPHCAGVVRTIFRDQRRPFSFSQYGRPDANETTTRTLSRFRVHRSNHFRYTHAVRVYPRPMRPCRRFTTTITRTRVCVCNGGAVFFTNVSVKTVEDKKFITFANNSRGGFRVN